MIYLLLTGRYLVAFVLFAAGVSKVRDRVHGVEVVERYGILPRWSVPAVAAFLPWCEVVLAVGLAAGIQPSLASLLACSLFAQFAAAIAWNVRKGKRFDCGCGIAEGPIGWDLVGRNILLGLIAVAVGDGPATGLSLWTGWTARTWSVPSPGKLIPVPLIVVIAIAAARCARTSWMAWRIPPTRALQDQ
jgi:uncharacterized membrane protein YphA (DoxX/SURF4 family)